MLESKVIYPYHSTTGEAQAPVYFNEPSPARPKEYGPLPAFSTSVPPPPVDDEQAAICVDANYNVLSFGGQWLIVTDHRGPYWLADGSEHEIIELGIERPVGALTVQPPPLVSAVADAKNRELMAACENELSSITYAYPTAERDTWDIQRQEAAAYQTDNTAPAPFIDALAAARGVTTAEQVARIASKSSAFQAAAAAAIGKRQQLVDQIETVVADGGMTDDEKRTAIEAIVW